MSGRLFTYIKYTKKNTPKNLYCDVCRSGFLSHAAKNKHLCLQKKSYKGRFRCRKCVFESELRSSIQAHVLYCQVGGDVTQKYDLIEKVMNSSNTEQLRLCPFCNKGFSANTNFREKHISECKNNPDRRMTRSTEWECKKCGKKYLLKTAAILHVQTVHGEHSVRGGNPTKNQEFKYRAEDIPLHFTELDENQIVDKLFQQTEAIIKELLKDFSLKAYPIFRFIVVKKKGLPDENIYSMYFSCEVSLIHIENYFSIVEHWTLIALKKFDESQNLGSGSELVELHSVSLLMYQFESAIGKGGNPTIPVEYYKNNRIVKIINVPNGNADCFHNCLCAAYLIHQRLINKHPPFLKATTRKIRKEIGKRALIDYSSLDLNLFPGIKPFLPMKIADIPKIEKYLKPFTLNVYALEKQKQEKKDNECYDTDRKCDDTYVLRTLFVSKNHGIEEEYVINILFYQNHYYLVNKLTSLIEKVQGRRHRTSSFCYNCLNSFDERYTNIREHLKMCISGVKTRISYPSKGEKKKFKRFSLTLLKPFFAVADFESSLLHIEKKESTISQKTKRVKKHSVNSVCVVIYTDENLDNFPYDVFEKYRYYYDEVKDDTSKECERLIKNFILHLNECALFFGKWIDSLDSDNQLAELKPLYWDEFFKTTKCMFCKTEFNEISHSSSKNFHHDHYRRKYLGALCLDCNFKTKKSRQLDVFFHNASYDTNFILENLNFEEIGIEKDGWRATMKGQKISLICGKILQFRDSFALLPMGLAELASKIKDEDCIYQKKYLPFAPKGKQIYPYNYVSTIAKFKEKNFPKIEDFANDMGDDVSLEDYTVAKQFFDENFSSFGEWNKYYITMDVLSTIDVLISMRNYLYDIVGLDLLSAYSLPDLALNSLLFELMGKHDLNLVSSPDMYNMILKGTKGGISWASLRHHHIPESNRENEHLLYFDLKSSYPNAFRYPLPSENWEFVEISSPNELIKYVQGMDMSKKGCLVKIDCFSPKETHDYLNDLPPIITKTCFDSSYYPKKDFYKRGNNIEKLIGHFGPVFEQVFTCHEFLLMINLGVTITKVHSVLEYSACDFACEFITKISQARQQAILEENDALSFIIKIYLNSIFGKCLLNKLKYHQTNIAHTADQLERRVKNIRFKASCVQKYSAIVTSHQKKVHLDSLIHVGCAILGISKMVLISQFYTLKKYIDTITYITPKPIFRGLYFDTDSALVLIKNIHRDQLYSLFKEKMSHIFDWSNIDENHPLFNTENRFKIGLLKNEVDGYEIQEANAVGSKMYDLIFFRDQRDRETGKILADKNKCKGVPKRISSKFTSEMYRQSHTHFASENPNTCLNSEILFFIVEKDLRKTYTYSVTKKVLNPHDRKRYVLPNSLDSLSLNHYRIKIIEKEKENI